MSSKENETLKPVTYGRLPADALACQHAVTVDVPFELVLERLRNAIEAAGLWVLHEINPQMMAARAGYALHQGRQILFFHPRYLARAFEVDPAILLEAPLKFAVLELPGSQTTIRWIDPTISFGRYGNPALQALGEELAQLCQEIVGCF